MSAYVVKFAGIHCLSLFCGLPAALGQAIPAIVAFPDPQLEAAVRCSLSDYTSATSNLDMPSLTCLWACNRQVGNLDGLQSATNLVNLYLNNNAISDLTPLGGLTQLSALESPAGHLKQLLGIVPAR